MFYVFISLFENYLNSYEYFGKNHSLKLHACFVIQWDRYSNMRLLFYFNYKNIYLELHEFSFFCIVVPFKLFKLIFNICFKSIKYPLRPILLVAQVDVPSIEICLDTSIRMTSNMDQRE